MIVRCIKFFSCLTFFVLSQNVLSQECANIEDHGAIADSTSHYEANTVVINNVLSEYSCAYVPKGIFWISVGAGGIILPSGSTLKGMNSESSMLVAADRVSGAMIRRNAPRVRSNETDSADYVTGVSIKNIGVIMNHPPYNNENPEMIGIDFSHISGSTISDVYVGNIPWGLAAKTASITNSWVSAKSDLVQGIGIMICTKSSGDPSYAGGERNAITAARVWGAKIGISIDDYTHCPLSGAHATIVRNSDIQSIEYGIAQQSQYTAGVTFVANTIQDFAASGGNSATMLAAYVMYGHGNRIEGGYIEGRSSNLLKTLYLGDNSYGNNIDLGYVSMSSNPNDINHIDDLNSQIRYAGSQNRIKGFDFASGQWLSY